MTGVANGAGTLAGRMELAAVGPLAIGSVTTSSQLIPTATGRLEVTGAVITGGGTALGGVTLLAVRAGASLSANRGSIQLRAGDTVTIEAGATFGGNTATVGLTGDFQNVEAAHATGVTFLGDLTGGPGLGKGIALTLTGGDGAAGDVLTVGPRVAADRVARVTRA